MIDIVVKYFLYFIIYSFLGWSLEMLWQSIKDKKAVNRGFLIGPLCTIYGWGVLAIIILIGKSTGDLLAVFLKAILVCSILEYSTSYIMEKLFKARWWDYSDEKFNINGRICLATMIPFGIGGTFIVYVLHPIVERFVSSIPYNTLYIIAAIIFVIFLVDNIISFGVLNKIKNQINYVKKDSTEYIRDKVMEWLGNNSVLFRRLKSAYPKLEIHTKINKTLKKYKKN